jgi:hypothetical protein
MTSSRSPGGDIRTQSGCAQSGLEKTLSSVTGTNQFSHQRKPIRIGKLIATKHGQARDVEKDNSDIDFTERRDQSPTSFRKGSLANDQSNHLTTIIKQDTAFT